ncbi:MAG: hypothetical protein JNM41_06940 [Flavipsychrobacter sp.]|nr:hypothetical protein [Flavipsychrobacter sp.]
MKKQVVKLLGVFLFVVFLAGIMPKEYIHEAFFDHEDDIHPIYKKGEMVITKAHNHCSFLSFEFAPFLPAEVTVFSFHESAVHHEHYSSFYVSYCPPVSGVRLLRGPPAYVSI